MYLFVFLFPLPTSKSTNSVYDVLRPDDICK